MRSVPRGKKKDTQRKRQYFKKKSSNYLQVNHKLKERV